MLEQYSGLGNLAPWKTKKAESYVRTLSLKVPPDAVNRLGDVQGLFSTVIDRKTGDLLSANIEEAFSDGITEALRSLPVTADLDKTFEKVVGRVNLTLQRLMGEGGLMTDELKIDGTIIAQRGRDVAAAVWGRPSLVLFRRGIEGGPKLYDVLDTEDDTAATTAGTGFTNLISGKISGKDRMIIANQNLLDLLDRASLQEILSAPRTDTVTMLLRDALVARHENLDLAMLLLDGHSGGETKEEPEVVAVAKEKKAPKTTPIRAVAEGQNQVIKQDDESANTELTVAKHESSTQKLFKVSRIAFSKGASQLVSTAKQAGEVAASAGQNIGQKILDAVTVEEEIEEAPSTSKTETKASESKTKAAAKSASEKTSKKKGKKEPADNQAVHPAEALVNRWNGLSNRSRGLLIVSLVLVFFLNTSLHALGWQRGQAQETANYEKTISTIRQQLDSAEASMIYRDEERARRLLDEAAAAIALLPNDDDEQALLKGQLADDLAAKFDGLRHAITLESPEVLSTVVTQSGSPELQKIISIGGALWAGAADGTIFNISATDGSAEAVYAPENAAAPEIFLTHKDGLVTGTPDNLTYISTSGQALPQTINAGDYEISIADATAFGSRLYVLDAGHNRIIRLAGVRGGYTGPQVYNKDGTDLSNAVSLAIDGYVYVLTAGGQIIKMMSGQSENYSVVTTDPPLTAATVLRTPDENSDLYVLDSTVGRVVRFNKSSGNLISQYESPELRGATDLQVDEDAKSILVTKGNRLLRFTWPENEL